MTHATPAVMGINGRASTVQKRPYPMIGTRLDDTYVVAPAETAIADAV